jgi:soluble lytic murein transglycosylase
MFQLKNLACITILSICLLHFSPAAADIYRYVDEKGTVHFSNVPTDSRYRLYVRGGSSRSRYDSRRYDPIIREMSKKYGVDSDLVRAVIKAESDFDPMVVSRKGARGLMQLMPETAKDMRVRNVFAPRENIEGGVKYLRRLLDMFENDLPLTLAAYNAGENVVKQYRNQIPPYKETREYVKKVLRYLQDYKSVIVSSR